MARAVPMDMARAKVCGAIKLGLHGYVYRIYY